jgi:hypothetical protein
MKAAALGGLAILTTLAIGAFVIALGKFLQSDTFKKMTSGNILIINYVTSNNCIYGSTITSYCNCCISGCCPI